MTASQVARLTSAARTVTGRDAARQIDQRGLSWVTEADGSITIGCRLPADRAMTVINTVRAATTPVTGVRWSQSAADTLVDLVVCDRQVTAEVIVHDHGHQTHLEDGPAIAAEVAEAMGCGSDIRCVSFPAAITPAGSTPITSSSEARAARPA